YGRTAPACAGRATRTRRAGRSRLRRSNRGARFTREPPGMRGLIEIPHEWLKTFDASKPWHLLGLTLALLMTYAVLWTMLLWLWNRCLADLRGRSLRRLAFDAGLVAVVLLALYLRSQTDAVLACLVVASLVWRLTWRLRRERKRPLKRAAAYAVCALLALIVLQAAS